MPSISTFLHNIGAGGVAYTQAKQIFGTFFAYLLLLLFVPCELQLESFFLFFWRKPFANMNIFAIFQLSQTQNSTFDTIRKKNKTFQEFYLNLNLYIPQGSQISILKNC